MLPTIVQVVIFFPDLYSLSSGLVLQLPDCLSVSSHLPIQFTFYLLAKVIFQKTQILSNHCSDENSSVFPHHSYDRVKIFL